MKFNAKSLELIKAKSLPHATAADFLAIKEDGEDARKAMAEADEYFKAFVKQSPGSECVCCGCNQGGKGIIDALMGTAKFKWGLAHGEGFCSNCGYPARAHHEVPGVGRITNCILQYHPDGLSFEATPTEELTHAT